MLVLVAECKACHTMQLLTRLRPDVPNSQSYVVALHPPQNQKADGPTCWGSGWVFVGEPKMVSDCQDEGHGQL